MPGHIGKPSNLIVEAVNIKNIKKDKKYKNAILFAPFAIFAIARLLISRTVLVNMSRHQETLTALRPDFDGRAVRHTPPDLLNFGVGYADASIGPVNHAV
jgi:hypothetical protein